jgi:2-oxoglutarate ferredoxin oxidoreductase subunit beta
MNNINLKSTVIPTWCPGCHDFIVFSSLQQAIINQKIDVKDLVIIYDIGCIGNMADFFKIFGVHTLHGRSIPIAMGMKLFNPKLKIIVLGGDGGTYGEGLSHLLSAARLNIDITVIVANNHLYSLTTGQTSPTTPKGTKTKSTPKGVPSVPIEPISLIKGVNPEAYARHASCYKPPEVTAAIEEAINNKGFNLIDLEQLCVSFSKQLS